MNVTTFLIKQQDIKVLRLYARICSLENALSELIKEADCTAPYAFRAREAAIHLLESLKAEQGNE